jgi:hypothetical protein
VYSWKAEDGVEEGRGGRRNAEDSENGRTETRNAEEPKDEWKGARKTKGHCVPPTSHHRPCGVPSSLLNASVHACLVYIYIYIYSCI